MKNQDNNKVNSRGHNKMLWTIFVASILCISILFGTLYTHHQATQEYPDMEIIDVEQELAQTQEKLNDLLLEERRDVMLLLKRNTQRIDHEIQELQNNLENAAKKKKEALRHQLAEKRKEKKEFESAIQKVKTATDETWQDIKLELEEWQANIQEDLKSDQS